MSNKLNFIYLIILGICGALLAGVLVLIFKETIFGGVNIDYLFIYSTINFLLAIVLLVVISLILIIIKKTYYRPYVIAFLVGFSFMLETIIIIVLYDSLTYFGIHVPMGYCPWKHLRAFLTIVFLLTYVSLYRAYGNIERIISERQKGK